MKTVRYAREGFTLIEILIVSMIVVVVAGIVLVLYQTVNTVRETQGDISEGNAALGQAMRVISRDLACSYTSKQEGAEFVLKASNQSDQKSSALGFVATLRDTTENELSWSETTAIQYYVDSENYVEPTLLRVSQSLVGPGAESPPVTNELVRDVKLFSMEVFDGEKWSGDWSSQDEEGLPLAAKISIDVLTNETTSTQRVTKVYIAAGNEPE